MIQAQLPSDMPLLGISQINKSSQNQMLPLQDIDQLQNRMNISNYQMNNIFITGKKEKAISFIEKENNTTGKKTVIDKTKFKTEMCKNWIEKQQCNYGDKCKFAHGKYELNEKIIQEKEKYKSKKCQSFYTKGYCLYGVKCLFKHEDRKLSQILHIEEDKVVPQENEVKIKEETRYQQLLNDGYLNQTNQEEGQAGLHAFIKARIGDSIKTKLNIFKDIKTKNMSAQPAFQADGHLSVNLNNCCKRLLF